MKKSMSFLEGFYDPPVPRGSFKTFDWDEALEKIKELIIKYGKDIKVEAGLQGDFEYTGGTIFYDSKLNIPEYSYLSSNWAIPTMIVSIKKNEEYEEVEEIQCYFNNNNKHYNEKSTWEDKHFENFEVWLNENFKNKLK